MSLIMTRITFFLVLFSSEKYKESIDVVLLRPDEKCGGSKVIKVNSNGTWLASPVGSASLFSVRERRVDKEREVQAEPSAKRVRAYQSHDAEHGEYSA